MRLQQRTVLVTGGTSGIGLEFAKQLMARGNVVIVTGRDAAKLAAAERSAPGLHTIRSDVSDPAAVVALHGTVIQRFPKLDTLINNAGIMRNLKLNQGRELEDVTREIDVNLNGPLRMVQQFLPHLTTVKDALIVNVSSGLAFIPYPISPVYSAAKAGLHAYTKVLRLQLARAGVTVVEVAPPPVETPLFRTEFAEETKGQKAMDPQALVKRALSGIEAGKTEITPGLANVLKTMSRLAPSFMLNQMDKMTQPKTA